MNSSPKVSTSFKPSGEGQAEGRGKDGGRRAEGVGLWGAAPSEDDGSAVMNDNGLSN